MEILAKIAEAVGAALKKAATALLKKGVADVAIGGEEKRHKTLKGVLIVVIILYYILYMGVEFIIGPVVHFTENVTSFIKGKGYTEQEVNAIIGDAASLADFMKENRDFELTDQNSFLMDRKTVIRVLNIVADYNKKMDAEKSISYEYKVIESVKRSAPVNSQAPTEEFSTDESEKNEELASSGTGQQKAGSTTAGEKYFYEDVESYAWDKVKLSTKNIDYAPSEVGENIFYVHWQPILALCSMYIQDNMENIGTYTETDVDGDSFYLSNAEITSIIGLISYEYTYYQDYVQSNLSRLSFNYINTRPSGYILDENVDGDVTTVKRIPAIAPKEIKNSYLTYKYIYENLEDGTRRLKERTCIMNAAEFVAACKELIPSFNADLFVEILSLLPGTEKLSVYYRDVVIKKAKTGELYTNTVSDPEVCPSIGVLLSNPAEYSGNLFETLLYGKSYNEQVGEQAGATQWDGDSYEIPLYSIDGWNGIYVRPGEWIVEEGNDYGSYYVYEDAMNSLTVSDGFSLGELEYLFENGGFKERYPQSPLFINEQAIKDTARCFYDYQEETGTSVCGLLGIMRQEGGFSSVITRNGWNYFNIKASGTQPKTSYEKADGTLVHTDFRNYKADYENNGAGTYETAAVNALAAQMNWINRNYWQKGQNSYYTMVWNGYEFGEPEQAYEGISHSYCPPWDDQAMPYSHESYRIVNGEKKNYWKNANENNKGWINRCAQYRYEYYTYVRE